MASWWLERPLRWRMDTVLRLWQAAGAALSRLSVRAAVAVFAVTSADLVAVVAGSDRDDQAVTAVDPEQTLTLTDDGSGSPTLNIFLPFEEGVFGIGLSRDCVKLPIDVRVAFSDTANDPDEDPDRTPDSPESVIPLGPLFWLELPYAALKLGGDPAQKVMAVAPALDPEYRDFFEPTDPLGVEVRIRRADGSESFSLEAYTAGGGVIFYKSAFDRAYGDSPPDIISVSVQPVDYDGVLGPHE